MNSIGYLVQTYFFEHGDTANIADDLNWYWGLGLSEGDAPIDTYLLLSGIGVILSIPFLWYTLRRFRDDLVYYCKDMVHYETRKQKIFFTIGAFILLPSAGGLLYLLELQLENIDFSSYLIIGSWEGLTDNEISSILGGLIIIASLLGLLFLNKYLTRKVREDLSVKHSKILIFDVMFILFFLIFPYFQIMTNYEDNSPWERYSSEYLPTPQGFFEFVGVYNYSNNIWSYRIQISTSPENTSSHDVNLFNTPMIGQFFALGDSGISPLMLPNLTLWVFTVELPDVVEDPNANFTLYATTYNFSSIDLYNPPDHISWENRFPINYSGILNLDSVSLKPYFNPDTGEIWLIYQYNTWTYEYTDYGTRQIIYGPICFARINPNTTNVIDNQILDTAYGDILLQKTTEIIFNGNDTLLIYEAFDGVYATQASDFFSNFNQYELIFEKRDDEYFNDFIIHENTLVIPSRFNRDIWATSVDLSNNYEIINSRARITSDFPKNYLETSCYYRGKYYIKAYQPNEYFNEIYTTYSSTDGDQWTSI